MRLLSKKDLQLVMFFIINDAVRFVNKFFLRSVQGNCLPLLKKRTADEKRFTKSAICLIIKRKKRGINMDAEQIKTLSEKTKNYKPRRAVQR